MAIEIDTATEIPEAVAQIFEEAFNKLVDLPENAGGSDNLERDIVNGAIRLLTEILGQVLTGDPEYRREMVMAICDIIQLHLLPKN